MGSYSDELKESFGEIVASLDDLGSLQKDFLTRRWLDQILWMEGAATRAQARYYSLRLVTVVGAVVVPVLIGLNLTGDAGGVVSWVAVGLSLVVATSAAVEEFFNFGQRWRHYRRTVERLKAEGWLFFELVGDYVSENGHAGAFPRFAARVEDLLREDVDVYVTQVVREKDNASEELAVLDDRGRDDDQPGDGGGVVHSLDQSEGDTSNWWDNERGCGRDRRGRHDPSERAENGGLARPVQV